MICPECMGTLAVATPVLAKCTTHGGVYRVLFQRGPGSVAVAPRAAAAVAPAAAPSSAGGATCVRHPAVEATLACARCNSAVCDTCAFPRPDGTIHCPDCASGRMLGIVDRPVDQANVPCALHPEVMASERCTNCRKAICATCDFAFEGGLHFCPTCATSSQSQGMSGKRKKLVIASYALGAWCSLGFVLFLIASVAMAGDDKNAETLGGVFTLFVLFPALIGVGVGIGSLDRRLGNPWYVWGGAIWNGLILAGFVGLMILGMMAG
jgi:hypothetical protein